MSYKIALDLDPTDADIRTVKHHLMAFNNQYAEPEHYQRLVLFVRDTSEKIVGGLLGYTHWPGSLYKIYGWQKASVDWVMVESLCNMLNMKRTCVVVGMPI